MILVCEKMNMGIDAGNKVTINKALKSLGTGD